MAGMLAEGREPVRLVTAIGGALLGPVAWLVDLELSYLLVPHVCETGRRAPLLWIGLVALGLTFAGALLCRYAAMSNERKHGRGGSEEVARDRWAGLDGFLLASGLALNALSAVAIGAQMLPKLILDPCAS